MYNQPRLCSHASLLDNHPRHSRSLPLISFASPFIKISLDDLRHCRTVCGDRFYLHVGGHVVPTATPGANDSDEPEIVAVVLKPLDWDPTGAVGSFSCGHDR